MLGRPLVLLYNPRVYDGYVRPPLPLLSIARVLDPACFQTVIVDGNVEPAALERLEALAARAVCLAVTVMPGQQTRTATEQGRRLRSRLPQLPVVWGGYFPSLYPESCLRSGLVDVVVRGLGEQPFPAIVERLAADGRRARLDGIPGVAYLEKGDCIQAPPPPLADLNRFPPLDWGSIPLARYLNRTWLGRRTVFHISSVGCPFNCGFCAIPAVNGQRWNTYHAERVASDVRVFSDDFGADGVHFMDTEFFVNEPRVRELAAALGALPRPVRWWAMGHPDRLAHYRDSTWQLLAAAGCAGLFTGIESGDPAVLARMGKRVRPEQAIELARITRRYGIVPEFSFVLGFPPEPERDIAASLELMRALKRANPRSHLVPHVYTPLPGTGAYGEAQAAGFRPPSSLEAWQERRWYDLSRMRGPTTPWLAPRQRRVLTGLETTATYLNYVDSRKSTSRMVAPLRRLLELAVRWRWRRGVVVWPLELPLLYRAGRAPVKGGEVASRGLQRLARRVRQRLHGPLGVAEGYRRWADRYDADLATNPLAQAEERVLARLLAGLPARRVLDAGCGTGRHSRLALAAGAGRVLALDRSLTMLRRWGAGFQPAAWRIAGDLRHLPLPDGAVDLALCGLTITHLSELDGAVGELARVLQPGGALLLSVPHPSRQAEGWGTIFQERGRTRSIRTIHHRFGDYQRALERAGLRVEQAQEPDWPQGPAEYRGLPLVLVLLARKPMR